MDLSDQQFVDQTLTFHSVGVSGPWQSIHRPYEHGTLWAHPEITQRTLTSLAERTHVHRRAIAILSYASRSALQGELVLADDRWIAGR